MLDIRDAAADFLAQERIAVTGVSRKDHSHGSNIVFLRLRQRGYEVYPVNPNATEVEGVRCYPDLKSIRGRMGGVVIGARPETAQATLQECVELGIRHVWMHRAFGPGSVSAAAAAWGREHGLRVIDGGCPLMFGPTADWPHKLFRWVCTMTGNVPRGV